MKRLSDFGFVPKLLSSQEKRPRHSVDTRSADSPQPSEAFQLEQPQLPQLRRSSEPQQSPESLQVTSKFVRNDIGTYSSDRLRRLSDDDRFWLLQNAFRPDNLYKYPTKVEYKQHSFQHNWLVQFPWLYYSESCNGGYCVHCVLFARCSMPLGQLVTCPMSNLRVPRLLSRSTVSSQVIGWLVWMP